MRQRCEHPIETFVAVADGRGAVDVHRRPDVGGDALEGNTLAVQHAVGASESGGQYALAHTASAVAARPHLRQCSGGSADRNSSSGNTRIVAFVSSLICASHSLLPHHPAYTNAPSPSMTSRKRSYV